MRPGPSPLGRNVVLLPIRLPACRHIDTVLKRPGVNPASACRGPVLLQRREAFYGFIGRHDVAVDLLQYLFRARLSKWAMGLIIPLQIADRPVALLVIFVLVQFLQQSTEIEDKVQLTSRVALWLQCFVMPLHETLSVCKAAVLFR